MSAPRICAQDCRAAAREVAISTGADNHVIGDLRGRVEQDQVRLASLAPESSAYRQLRRRIIRDSVILHEREEDSKRRAGHVKDLRLLYLLIGGVVAVAGWGSWKVLIGPAVALFGVWVADRLPDRFYR